MQVVEQVTDKEQRERFFKEKELDMSYSVPQLGRHRVNMLFQKGAISIAFRLLSAVLSLCWPEGNRALYVGLTLVTYPLAWVVSHVLLLVMFALGIARSLSGALAVRVARLEGELLWLKGSRKAFRDSLPDATDT